jgi:glyoxylase-like metal-dependent hydrolase (beta-lactamase superfamily II)
MIFEQIPVGQMQNFSYLIGDENSKEAAVVDPAWENGKILEHSKKHNLNIKFILITHSHYDHIDGVKRMFDATDATVYVHKDDLLEIEKLNIEKIEKIKNNQIISIGKIKSKVLHTPGHTPGSVCYLLDNKIIAGDMLFVEGIGRVDLPGGDIGEMFNSLQKLKELDGNIEVYPGHDYGSRKSSTIAYEKKNNPYMKASKEEFFRIR